MTTRPERQSRPGANRTASNVNNGDPFSLGQTLDRWARRLLTDCLNEATRSYWLKRAESFERAKPRVGDFHGASTREELSERWRRADEIARACRMRASIAPLEGIAPEVELVLREVS